MVYSILFKTAATAGVDNLAEAQSSKLDLDRTVILSKQVHTSIKVYDQHGRPEYTRGADSGFQRYQYAVKLQFKTDRLPPHDTISIDKFEPESKGGKTHKAAKVNSKADSMVSKWAKLVLLGSAPLDKLLAYVEEDHK